MFSQESGRTLLMASHPTKIGKYEVEGVLGRGGMGVVYKAVDPQIGRYVAIKMITGGGDENLIERFKSEAKTMGSLQCPNIVTVYNVGEQDGNPYLVMQFLEGSSLEAMIRKRASLTLPESLGIIIDACNGLAYAHQRGVIHRDIKPANIIVLQDGINDGTAVIVDFGIARVMGDTGLTRPDQIIGSIQYMSPEQLQAKELDNRTDIYSLGVVLFQLLTGVSPFEANEAAAALVKILNDAPPHLSAYSKEFPVELGEIIARVLAKNRDDRFATAEDLSFHLMRVRDQVKSEIVSQLVRRAEAAVDQEAWTQARGHLQQALRIDRHNPVAQKLMNSVQERLRLQQEIGRARGLRTQANEAYADHRYDDAVRLLDQAILLDPKSNDLFAFLQSVQDAKERATQLRRALRRAEAALEDGDLDEAESAAKDALSIDPSDTQARALKVVVSQRAEEKSRQDQLRKLLDQARDEIAARDLTAAFATLKNAEALDPTSHDFQAVAKMAVSAREQERRRLQVDEVRRQLEGYMVRQDFATAVVRAEEGLRKFPQEQSLTKLKALAETELARVEQKKLLREQLAVASSLAESGKLNEAMTALDAVLRKFPGTQDKELEGLRSRLRDRVTAEEADRKEARAIDAILDQGRQVLRSQGARSARLFLDAKAVSYADSPLVRKFYDTVRARDEMDALEARLAEETNPAKRVQFAEEAARSSPDNEGIRLRLSNLQQEREQIRQVIDQARSFEAAGRFSEAIKELQRLKKSYPKVSEFELEIKRLETAQKQARRASTKASPPRPVAGSPKAPAWNESATQVLDSSSLQGADAMPNSVSSETSEPATISLPGGAVPEPISRAMWPGLSAADVQRRLIDLLEGSGKYLTLAVVVVVIAVAYLLLGRSKPHRTETHPPIQVHIHTIPADATVSIDSKPIADRTVSLASGTSANILVTRLGYQPKPVQLRQESDGNVALEPEPIQLSIQTSEKTGTVELDGAKIADLAGGAMEVYSLVPDGKSHKLSVAGPRKRLFEVEFQAEPASMPQVKTFDANGLFLITSLGGSAKVYAGNQLKNVRLGEQDIPVNPSGAGFSLSEQNHEVIFGEGSAEKSVSIENSNAPTLAVYPTTSGGQIRITSNVKGATLKVDGVSVKPQGNGWLLSTTVGKYTLELSAEGYKSQTKILIVRPGQILSNQEIDLEPAAIAAVLASLIIVGGTPEAQVKVDGATCGRLDADGKLQKDNFLTEGRHSIGFTKLNFEPIEFPVTITGKQSELRLVDGITLKPWPRLAFQTSGTSAANVTVTYKRVGESQPHQTPASEPLVLPPGEYDFAAEAAGFHEYVTKLNLVTGDDTAVPLKLDPIQDYQFQEPTKVFHDSEWIKSKDPHSFVFLKAGLLHENLIFEKPGKILKLVNKKVEWRVESADRSASVEYMLDGQRLVRKLVVGEEPPDTKEYPKVDIAVATRANALSVHIQVDGSHVTISNDKGVILDDCDAKRTFSGGRIGIKAESRFLVREP